MAPFCVDEGSSVFMTLDISDIAHLKRLTYNVLWPLIKNYNSFPYMMGEFQVSLKKQKVVLKNKSPCSLEYWRAGPYIVEERNKASGHKQEGE